MASSLILQGGASITKTLQETITQPGHGFIEGDVLRWSNTLSAYTKAQANTALNAEVAGVVSEYIDANNFKITYHGYIEIDAFSARTDPVMFLSADTAGGLTGAPPSAVGTVVKPVLTKNTNSTGYLVMNYLGTQIGGSSTVAVDEIQPVGTIMPYAGTVIPDTWLECDGGSYGITDYPELYEKLLYESGERAPLYGYMVELGMNSSASAYYANLAVGNILLFRQSGNPDSTAYDAAGLVVSKTAPSIASPGAYPVTVKILPKYDSVTKKFQFPNFVVTVNTGIVPFTDYTLGTRVTGAAATAHASNFIAINKFLTPDLRGRFLLGMNPAAIGETEGDTTFISSTGQYTMASIGGEELHTLTTGEMPAHNHSASTNSTGAHTHTAQSAGAHTHTATVVTRSAGSVAPASNNTVFPVTNTDTTITTSSSGAHTHTTDSQGDHSHTVTVGNSGSNTAHNNMPPYLAVRYIIKAKPYTRAAIIDGIDLPYNSLLVRDLRTRNVGGSNSDLVFLTNTSGDSGNGTERMRITTGGLVGIGNSSPTYALDVRTGGSLQAQIAMSSSTLGGLSILGHDLNGDAYFYETASGKNMRIGTSNTERLRITAAGDIGIANTSPGATLDVNGTLRVGDFGGVTNVMPKPIGAVSGTNVGKVVPLIHFGGRAPTSLLSAGTWFVHFTGQMNGPSVPDENTVLSAAFTITVPSGQYFGLAVNHNSNAPIRVAAQDGKSGVMGRFFADTTAQTVAAGVDNTGHTVPTGWTEFTETGTAPFISRKYSTGGTDSPGADLTHSMVHHMADGSTAWPVMIHGFAIRIA